VLIVTGLIQMSLDSNYNGFMDFNNTWSKVILMKHIALIGMIVSGAIMQFSVIPALERASLLAERGKDDPTQWQALRRQEIRLTWINVLLGIAVLGFSAWAGTL
jgi:putative copper export protein